MKTLLTIAAGIGVMVVAAAPAEARQGCGAEWHRGTYGHCRPNQGVVAVPVRPVVD